MEIFFVFPFLASNIGNPKLRTERAASYAPVGPPVTRRWDRSYAPRGPPVTRRLGCVHILVGGITRRICRACIPKRTKLRADCAASYAPAVTGPKLRAVWAASYTPISPLSHHGGRTYVRNLPGLHSHGSDVTSGLGRFRIRLKTDLHAESGGGCQAAHPKDIVLEKIACSPNFKTQTSALFIWRMSNLLGWLLAKPEILWHCPNECFLLIWRVVYLLGRFFCLVPKRKNKA